VTQFVFVFPDYWATRWPVARVRSTASWRHSASTGLAAAHSKLVRDSVGPDRVQLVVDGQI
jgi:hypothetical protein